MHNVVVIINGGTRSIERKLLDKLAQAAGADSWELVDLPDPQRGLTTDAPVNPHICPLCKGNGGYVVHGHGWTRCGHCNGAGADISAACG